MVRQSRYPKHIATDLIGTEEGDEVSIVADGEHARGQVVQADETEDGHQRVLDTGSTIVEIRIDISDDAESHAYSSDEDFDVYTSTNDEVETVLVWDGFELPDEYLSELDDDEVRDEIEDGIDEQIEGLERALTEIQTLRDINRAVRDEDITLQEMEERSYALEMDSGGRLALDQF